MLIYIDEKPHEIPFDPLTITLSKYIEFHKTFGEELDKEFLKIMESKDNIEVKSRLIDDHLDKEALSWFSFWSNTDLRRSSNVPGMIPVIDAYKSLRFLFKIAEEDAEKFPFEFEWAGDTWVIQDFKVNAASEMTFNEIVTSKEVMRQISDLGAGKWDAMPYLCAIYLRKKGEPFKDSLIFEGSERLKLFQDLPLQYALYVGFFMKCSVSIFAIRSAYSEKTEHQIQSPN